jgi:hypothetical protein
MLALNYDFRFYCFWAPSPFYVVGACLVIQAVDSEDVWVVQSLFLVLVWLSPLLSHSVLLLLFTYVKSSVVIVCGGPLICILLFWGDGNSMRRCITAVSLLVTNKLTAVTYKPIPVIHHERSEVVLHSCYYYYYYYYYYYFIFSTTGWHT